MLHGIEMNVVHVSGEVVVITNSVFPVARLPQGKFAVGMASDFDTCNQQVGAEMPLMRRQRPGKSASPSGSVNIACK